MAFPQPAAGPDPMMDEEEPNTEAPKAGADEYSKAGRTIRHALADGDDDALGHAVCDLIDYHSAKEPDGADAKGEPAEKPNLALILAQGRKGKK